MVAPPPLPSCPPPGNNGGQDSALSPTESRGSSHSRLDARPRPLLRPGLGPLGQCGREPGVQVSKTAEPPAHLPARGLQVEECGVQTAAAGRGPCPGVEKSLSGGHPSPAGRQSAGWCMWGEEWGGLSQRLGGASPLLPCLEGPVHTLPWSWGHSCLERVSYAHILSPGPLCLAQGRTT